jgi:hypothetical protein
MKRSILLTIAVAAIAVAFAVICFLVTVTHGHPLLVKSKLKMGALLLTLGWFSSGCNNPFRPTISCYSPLPSDVIQVKNATYIDGLRHGLVTYDRTAGNDVTGSIEERHLESFSFAISDTAENAALIQKEDLIPLDGTLDESSEEFALTISDSIPAGRYLLHLFPFSADAIDQEDIGNSPYTYYLDIIDSTTSGR